MAAHPTAKRSSLLHPLHGMPLQPTAMAVSDSHAAQIRHRLLQLLENGFPAPRTIQELEHECRVPYMSKYMADLYKDAIKDQLKVLSHAALVRPLRGGYTLTEKGRRNRQEVARLFKNKPSHNKP